jgi:hypothetical protein
MVLDSIEELKEHAELMRKFPEMEHADIVNWRKTKTLARWRKS